MSDIADLMRRVRRRGKDRPDRALVQDDPLSSVAASVTILAADVAKFRESGIFCNFDDETDELVYTSGAADTTAATVAVSRGQDGTAASAHLKGTAMLIRPRYSNAELIDAISYVTENELWPHVWLAGESTLAYQSANEYFTPTVPDIEEVVYAYQLSGGIKYELHAEFLSLSLADDLNFPNGAVIIRRTVDSSAIYFAYRARPALGSLTSMLENLVVMGAFAELVMTEEGAFVGGDSSAVQKRVADGSRLKAGAVLWNRFESSRTQERIRLQHEEQAHRRTFLGAGHA